MTRDHDINIVANKEFLAENPSAAKLLEVIAIPLSAIFDQNNRMNDGEDSQEDIDRHAHEWAAANEGLWNSWLDEARAAE